jgi:hypothetical protein
MSIIKDFFLKNAAKFGTRNLPKDQQEMIMKIVEKNPGLFEKIANETKALMDNGKPEMYATFEVMQKYQKELQSILAGEDTNKLQQMAKSVIGKDAANDDVFGEEDKKAA